jgi:hypothetical protein
MTGDAAEHGIYDSADSPNEGLMVTFMITKTAAMAHTAPHSEGA